MEEEMQWKQKQKGRTGLVEFLRSLLLIWPGLVGARLSHLNVSTAESDPGFVTTTSEFIAEINSAALGTVSQQQKPFRTSLLYLFISVMLYRM